MIVMKFGGSSVQNEEAISRVISIVSTRLREKPVVVVSALAKVTRMLVEIAETAENQNIQRVQELLGQLRRRHFDLCASLLEGEILESASARLEQLFGSLESFVDGVCQIGELSPRSRARIVSTGELLSSTIVAAAMNQKGIICNWADARKMVITDSNYMGARPDLETTRANVRREIGEASRGADIVLTQGFIASTPEGWTTVLGFEGSDFTAAILGMALDAERVEIWTDVDGIRTADPRVVPDTQRIEAVSYDEAAEMAHLGARVLHPLTMGPARMKNIPIRVMNTMNPEGDGSWVTSAADTADGAKSVAFFTEIDFLEVFSDAMTGTARMLGTIMDSLRLYGVEPQIVGCSGQKVSLTFETGQEGLSKAVEAISGDYRTVLSRDRSQLSIVGRNVARIPGLSALIVESAKVYMIAEGADFQSISAVVDRTEVKDAVAALHGKLFNPEEGRKAVS